MKEIRCKHCGKLLAKANVADIETVCPKCKLKNKYKVNQNEGGNI
jgi:phage FluMu protein Com